MTGQPLFISVESRSIILPPVWYASPVTGSGLLGEPVKHILALIALAALSSPAWGEAALEMRVLPPEEFDHPFEGALTVTIVKSMETVNKLCGNPQAGVGCALVMNDGKVCSIIMAADDVIRSRGLTPEIVKRHEMGHCNGWPAHHPGARFP
jgi:hypothetical protein